MCVRWFSYFLEQKQSSSVKQFGIIYMKLVIFTLNYSTLHLYSQNGERQGLNTADIYASIRVDNH